MRPRLVKLATWNIGGGVLGESHQRDRPPSLDYYVSVLEAHTPDVVCLQEAHDYHGSRESQAEYLARCAGYPYHASFPVSESHLDADASLALGILSRFPLKDFRYKPFPNPGIEAVGPNGEAWRLHDKGYAVGSVDVAGRSFGLINGHCFPLHRFDASPAEPRFAPMWKMLARDMLAIGDGGHAWAAMDLNYGRVADLLGEVLCSGSYFSAFDRTPTTPEGAQRDHILYGHAMRLLTTVVESTESDHSYCQVDVLV